MLNKINEWIDQTLENFSGKQQSCEKYASEFEGFYPSEFLSNSYFVVVDKIPKPKFPELYQAGLGDFVDMDVDGITYKNTYFIKPSFKDYQALHFHELIHVLQWKYLGALAFIQRYIGEIRQYGYKDAPLERMAYFLQGKFMSQDRVISIPEYVQKKI